MKLAFPGETAQYRAARDTLLNQEIALRREMEALAAARRALPPGGLVPEDYTFEEMGADGKPVTVRLSELFAPGRDSLIVYNMMFPRHKRDDRPKAATGITAELPREEGPCPSCVAFLDQIDGAAGHLRQTHNHVVVAKAPIARVAAFARDRGWKHLRLLSSGMSRFKRDYGAEDPEGQQQPMTNVFQRGADGIRHFWSSEMLYAPADPGQNPRHMGTAEPLWTLQDFTPEGRAQTWHEQLDYACCH
ncbi:MAG TPA: DUF899 family protein [Rhizomicrobium sp.]|jgi:predicted dithiol-disulfide oxidoreductase (DUF899 family)|nr:DUF899 family protein [Rhizomicrobium sp.]